MKIEQKIQAVLLGILAFGILLVSSGCGKNEATGGALGAGGGALAGALIAGPNNAGVGAAIGGLAGWALGSSAGRVSDDEETADQIRARERAHRQEVNQLQQEKARIAQAQAKWCSECGRQEMDVRAKRCGPCGGSLCHEKYCPRCGERYKPTIKNKYCNYCDEPTLLRAQ